MICYSRIYRPCVRVSPLRKVAEEILFRTGAAIVSLLMGFFAVISMAVIVLLIAMLAP